ncbi:NADPH-dependent ferric siderophore reductase [Pseudomonas marincola]|uniref:NADPH-dependent ferric siderophore reductase n=1 Tax=Pseudomonas marincola TaxID=437900 RepID=A0A653E7F0_9PSED|nr:siderophore-interacting protein [Pseudomonas marincola]CAE6901817.1 NADPH-dependent ferric siderophore reductase [Pseudomonas marincola]
MATTQERRVQRVRHELRRRDVQVTRINPIGSGFVSLTFAGEALQDFTSLGFDDHIKFMFADADGETVRRDYTPRHFDPVSNELTVEFALHGDGQVSEWARNAKVGDNAIIGGPRGSMIVPMDYAWHLFISDETGLPAVSRRLEELPANSHAIVIAQVADAADQRKFAAQANVQVQWVQNADELIDAVVALQLPEGDGFAWGAGEASSMAKVRKILADDKGHSKQAMRVAAYWRHGASDFHEELSQPE